MIWPQSHIDFIKQHYNNVSPYAVAIVLMKNKGNVYNMAFRLGLKSSHNGCFKPGVSHSPGTEFKKGVAPANKGKKQIEFMSEDAIMRTAATRFKKGQASFNEKQDGAISIRIDKRGVKYQHIRISKANWQPLHRHVWEKHNGTIAKDKVVAFVDGNTLNCEITNLQLISKAENAIRNSIHRYPEELKDVFRLMGRLKKKISNT